MALCSECFEHLGHFLFFSLVSFGHPPPTQIFQGGLGDFDFFSQPPFLPATVIWRKQRSLYSSSLVLLVVLLISRARQLLEESSRLRVRTGVGKYGSRKD